MIKINHSKNILVVDNADKNTLISILTKIIAIVKKNNIMITNVIVTTEGNFKDSRVSLSNDIVDKITCAYDKFTNSLNKVDAIYEDIFIIALAEMVYLNNIKYVYNYNYYYAMFMSDIKKIAPNINHFISNFNQFNINIDNWSSSIIGIVTSVNIYNVDTNEIVLIDFDNCIRFDRIIRLFASANIMSESRIILIKNVSIYNPYEGKFYSCNIGSLTTNKLLNYLDSCRSSG